MSSHLFIQNLYSKCKMHGTGGAQVAISDAELHALISLSVQYLRWDHEKLSIPPVIHPNSDYFQISLDWFHAANYSTANAVDIKSYLDKCFCEDNDFALFIENLTALHRRRIKYRRILGSQPLPTMDQIGPRALLEFGACDVELQAHWMAWRKWIYDIDNRSAQETGYLFEPLLASCLGGEPVGARNSPVRRIDENGRPSSNGRQVDCLVPGSNKAYELKLRVTIAASGQGRFGEELSFPVEAQAAGYIPVLLVLDPTGSDRLNDLAKQFKESGGEVYIGDDAWRHMEAAAGEVVSVFVERFIRPVISSIEQVDISSLSALSLAWSGECLEIRSNTSVYRVNRIEEC